MTLLNKSMRQNQILQQVKELAQEGRWQDAKELIDTLPSSPEVDKIRVKISKQLFITTGEIPAIMEGSMALADAQGDDDSTIAKFKRTMQQAPGYWPVRIAAYLIYGGGVLAMTFGVAMIIMGFLNRDSFYGGIQATNGFVAVISGFFTLVSGAMLLMFVDIARNTFTTNHLLQRLLDRGSK